MKIGKQPKRFGGPSQAFQERKAKERDIAAQTVPETGDVRLYLDDERHAPAGWTLARTGDAFRERMLANADRIVAVSLDWHLGGDQPHGTEHAQWLADILAADPRALPALAEIYIHTSDRDQAVAMARILDKAVPEDRIDDLWVMIGPPEAAMVVGTKGWK